VVLVSHYVFGTFTVNGLITVTNVRIVREKATTFSPRQFLCFVDFHKAFDSVKSQKSVLINVTYGFTTSPD